MYWIKSILKKLKAYKQRIETRKKIDTINELKTLLDGEFHNVHGEKGAGKTTTACALAQAAINDGRLVFSSRPIPGTYKISLRQLDQYRLPRGSLLILDEIGKDLNARDWHSTGSGILGFFQMCRHFKITIYAFGQLPNDADCRVDALKSEMNKIIKCGFGNHKSKIIRYDKYINENGDLKFSYPSAFKRLFSFKFDRRLFYNDFDSFDLGEYENKPTPDLVHWCISGEQLEREEAEAARMRADFETDKIMQLLFLLRDTERQRKIVDKNFCATEAELFMRLKQSSMNATAGRAFGAVKRSLQTELNDCIELYNTLNNSWGK